MTHHLSLWAQTNRTRLKSKLRMVMIYYNLILTKKVDKKLEKVNHSINSTIINKRMSRP